MELGKTTKGVLEAWAGWKGIKGLTKLSAIGLAGWGVYKYWQGKAEA